MTMGLDQLPRGMNDPERTRAGEIPHGDFQPMECMRFAPSQRLTFTSSKTLYPKPRILASATMSEK
jgi:hypothetical protein